MVAKALRLITREGSTIKPEAIKGALFTTTALNGIARGFGFLKNLAIAIFLGFNYQTDAFFFAMSLIAMVSIGASALDSVGLPSLI